jgi:hypothetical protein
MSDYQKVTNCKKIILIESGISRFKLGIPHFKKYNYLKVSNLD